MAAEVRALSARALRGLDPAARTALIESLRTVRQNLR
jgi:hypothetical protein